MNVQYPPLSRTLEEGGNRPTLNTWDSRDVLSALHKTLYMPCVCVCVALAEHSHKNRDYYSISPRLNKSLLFVSVFVSVTPTSCQAVSPLSSHTDTKGFHVVSFNCKPFASWTLSLRLHCSPVVQAEYTADTKNCFMHCVVYSTLWKELQSAYGTTGQILSETHLRHYIFGVSFPWCLVYISSLLLH